METDTRTTEKLSACPFCGDDSPTMRYKRDNCWWVECRNYHCARPTTDLQHSEQAAIEAWNRRAGHGEHVVTTREAVSSGEWLDEVEAALRIADNIFAAIKRDLETWNEGASDIRSVRVNDQGNVIIEYFNEQVKRVGKALYSVYFTGGLVRVDCQAN